MVNKQWTTFVLIKKGVKEVLWKRKRKWGKNIKEKDSLTLGSGRSGEENERILTMEKGEGRREGKREEKLND